MSPSLNVQKKLLLFLLWGDSGSSRWGVGLIDRRLSQSHSSFRKLLVTLWVFLPTKPPSVRRNVWGLILVFSAAPPVRLSSSVYIYGSVGIKGEEKSAFTAVQVRIKKETFPDAWKCRRPVLVGFMDSEGSNVDLNHQCLSQNFTLWLWKWFIYFFNSKSSSFFSPAT